MNEPFNHGLVNISQPLAGNREDQDGSGYTSVTLRNLMHEPTHWYGPPESARRICTRSGRHRAAASCPYRGEEVALRSRTGRRRGRKRIVADIAVLKAAQDLLGHLHDFEMLLVRAREVQATLSPPDLRAWQGLGSLMNVVECECRQLHARYMRDRTDLVAIANRMGASTRAARPVARRRADQPRAPSDFAR